MVMSRALCISDPLHFTVISLDSFIYSFDLLLLLFIIVIIIYIIIKKKDLRPKLVVIPVVSDTSKWHSTQILMQLNDQQTVPKWTSLKTCGYASPCRCLRRTLTFLALCLARSSLSLTAACLSKWLFHLSPAQYHLRWTRNVPNDVIKTAPLG